MSLVHLDSSPSRSGPGGPAAPQCPNPHCPLRDLLRAEKQRCLKLLSANDVLQQTQQYLIDKNAAIADELTASSIDTEASRRQTDLLDNELQGAREDLFELKRQHDVLAESAAATEHTIASLQERLSATHRENALLRDQVVFLQRALNDVTTAKLRTATPPRRYGVEAHTAYEEQPRSHQGAQSSLYGGAAPVGTIVRHQGPTTPVRTTAAHGAPVETPFALRSPASQQVHPASHHSQQSGTAVEGGSVRQWVSPMRRAIEQMQQVTAMAPPPSSAAPQPVADEDVDSVRSVPSEREQQRWPSATRRRRSPSPIQQNETRPEEPAAATDYGSHEEVRSHHVVHDLVRRYEGQLHLSSPQRVEEYHTTQQAADPTDGNLGSVRPAAASRQYVDPFRGKSPQSATAASANAWMTFQRPLQTIAPTESQSPRYRQEEQYTPRFATEEIEDDNEASPPPPPPPPEEDIDSPYSAHGGSTARPPAGGSASPAMPQHGSISGGGVWTATRRSPRRQERSPYLDDALRGTAALQMTPQPTPSYVPLAVHSLPSLRPNDQTSRSYGGSGGVRSAAEKAPQFFEFE